MNKREKDLCAILMDEREELLAKLVAINTLLYQFGELPTGDVEQAVIDRVKVEDLRSLPRLPGRSEKGRAVVGSDEAGKRHAPPGVLGAAALTTSPGRSDDHTVHVRRQQEARERVPTAPTKQGVKKKYDRDVARHIWVTSNPKRSECETMKAIAARVGCTPQLVYTWKRHWQPHGSEWEPTGRQKQAIASGREPNPRFHY